MKVCIITFHFARNFGAALQAYALEKYIEKSGHTCQIIDYTSKYESIQMKSVFVPFDGIKSGIVNLFSLLRARKLKTCCEKFKDFKRDFMNLTKNYDSMQCLVNDPPDADIYISGSDQVWNCSVEFKEPYFLGFGSEKVYKMSYAASIAMADIPEKYKQQFKLSLQQFDKISVREKSALKILSGLINKPCEVCLDPVFLLRKEDWLKVAEEYQIKSPYILCYSLSTKSNFNKGLEALKKRTGCRVVEVCSTGFSKVKSDKRIFDIGPKEFLYLINNASYVFTSSFHGTAFSIIFNKNFYTFAGNEVGSRIRDLLEMLDLTNRNIKNINLEKDKIMQIDYSKVNRLLEIELIKSQRYLEDVLNMGERDA